MCFSLQECDVAAAPFVARRRHHRVLSFTKPFLHSSLSLLLRAPQPGEDLSLLFVEDLLNQSKVTVGVVAGSHTYRQLRTSKDGVQVEIWRLISRDRKGSIVGSLQEAIQRVRAGNFALILQSTESAYIASQEPCDVMSLDQFLSITHYMFATRMSSPLVAQFNEALVGLQEDGVLQQLYHRWWNSDDCTGYVNIDEEDLEEYMKNATKSTISSSRKPSKGNTPGALEVTTNIELHGDLALMHPFPDYTIKPIIEEVHISEHIIIEKEQDHNITHSVARDIEENTALSVKSKLDIDGNREATISFDESESYGMSDTNNTTANITIGEGEKYITQSEWTNSNYVITTPTTQISESSPEHDRLATHSQFENDLNPTVEYDLDFYIPNEGFEHDFEEYVDNYGMEGIEQDFVTPDFPDFGDNMYNKDVIQEDVIGNHSETIGFFPPPPVSPVLPITLNITAETTDTHSIYNVTNSTVSSQTTTATTYTKVSNQPHRVLTISSHIRTDSETTLPIPTTRRSRGQRRKGGKRGRRRKWKLNAVTTEEGIYRDRILTRQRDRPNNPQRHRRTRHQRNRDTTETMGAHDYSLQHRPVDDEIYPILNFPPEENDIDWGSVAELDGHSVYQWTVSTPKTGFPFEMTSPNETFPYYSSRENSAFSVKFSFRYLMSIVWLVHMFPVL